MTGVEERTERLRQAARRKTLAAEQRAHTAVDDLTATHQDVTFRAVARHGHVSIDFLYRNSVLRGRIIELRAACRPAADIETLAPTNSTIIQALTIQLRKLRDENHDLRAQLAALHGELLRMRREAVGCPTSPTSSPDPHPAVTDGSSQTPSGAT